MAAASPAVGPPVIAETELLTFIEWDPEKFGIGVRAIDEQHKILIGLTNELTKAYVRVAYPKLVDAMGSFGIASPSTMGSSSKQPSASKNAIKATVTQLRVLNAIKETEQSSAKLLDPCQQHAQFPVVGFRQFDPLLQRKSELSKVVEDLVTYTCKFLLVEDHMLETYAYPDRIPQQQDHELFANEVSNLFKLVEEHSAQLSDVRRMLVFLRLWLSGHIPRDRKYAPMLIEKGVGS